MMWRAGAIVFDQIFQPGLIVGLEAVNEIVAGVAEAVDVLVVVADRHQGQAGILVLHLPAGQGADQVILALIDVLIFVDQNVAITGEQAFAQGVAVAIGPASAALP